MENREQALSRALILAARAANSQQPLKKVLRDIARSTTRALDCMGCAVMLLNSKKEYLSHISAYGLSDVFLKKGGVHAGKSMPEVLQGKVVAITNATTDPRVQYPQVFGTQNIASILGAPIISHDDVVGEVRVYTGEQRRFSDLERDFLMAIANIYAVILEKKQALPMLKTRSESAPLVAGPSAIPRNSFFAHPSEESFAKVLDFYQVEWLYEPRSFPLEWEGNRITEMFTPDFYLPELDLFVELTTRKQSLITEKNRKLRRLKELYPDINIKLLNRKDYIRLLARFGYGTMTRSKALGVDRVLLSHTQIQRRVRELAKRISRDYEGKQVVLVGILKGAVCFLSDLMQHLSLPVNVDFMAISYYGDDQTVKITKDLDGSITGKDVLMVEDIVDTGMTLNYVMNHLRAHHPATLRVCSLLDKRGHRIVDAPLDYVGFEVPDEFLVGYGLDYRGEYRNLPFVSVLSPEIIEREENIEKVQQT